MKKIGTITLERSVIVSDPCYTPYDILCNTGFEMKPGIYNCFVDVSERVSKLMVIHEEHRKPRKMLFDGTCSVDSGQMGIFDEDYYIKNQPDDDWDNPESWYRRVCELTINNSQYGTIENLGVVSQSGYGDGCYPVYYAKDKNDKTYCIEILF